MLAPRDPTPTWEGFVFALQLSGYMRVLAEEVELSAGGSFRALPIRERQPTLLRVASDLRALARMLESEANPSDEF
jgi:hypothetical protein